MFIYSGKILIILSNIMRQEYHLTHMTILDTYDQVFRYVTGQK